MIQGTSSGAGKSTLVIGFCRAFSDMGYKVSPFKAQNMTSNFYRLPNSSKRIAGIQAIQAIASRSKPDTRTNPILLEPIGEYRSNIFLNGRFYGQMTSEEYYEKFVLKQGFSTVLHNLYELRKDNDIIIMEGAGSPAEINIADYDVANMLLAERISAPVILVADIERGGCFASIIGTVSLLKPRHRVLVKGIVINKFRGDKKLLMKAVKFTEQKIKKEILGIVPRIEFALPPEDSLDDNKVQPVRQSRKSLEEQINILTYNIKECLDIHEIASRLVRLNNN
jgi:adenosylcobyric acid synthase